MGSGDTLTDIVSSTCACLVPCETAADCPIPAGAASAPICLENFAGDKRGAIPGTDNDQCPSETVCAADECRWEVPAS